MGVIAARLGRSRGRITGMVVGARYRKMVKFYRREF
jgi:hypothetical protein